MPIARLLAAYASLVLWSAAAAGAQVAPEKLGWGPGAHPRQGHRVAANGDYLVSVSPPGTPGQHAVVWRRSGATWAMDQVVPNFGNSYFGSSLALEGELLAIGGTNPTSGWDNGEVWVYERGASGWTGVFNQVGWGTGHAPENLGTDVALEQGVVYAGGPGSFYHLGGVWMMLADPTWRVQGILRGAGPGFWENFGAELEVDDHVLVAYSRAVITTSSVDRVDVRRRNSTGDWVHAQFLLSSVPGTHFARSLALDGDTLVATTDGGHRLEVFRDGPNGFELEGLVEIPAPWDASGPFSIDLAEGLLAVGAPYHDGARGAVLQFRREGSGFSLQDVGQLPDGQTNDRLGTSVAVSPYGVAAGAPGLVADQGGLVFFPDRARVRDGCHCRSISPCGNLFGDGGCLNASGTGAILSAYGSARAHEDDLVFVAGGLNAGTFGTLFMGRSSLPNPVQNGRLCLGAPLFRFAPVPAAGTLAEVRHVAAYSQVNFPAAYAITAEATWSFQLWYRDAGGPCGASSNYTNSLTVDFR